MQKAVDWSLALVLVRINLNENMQLYWKIRKIPCYDFKVIDLKVTYLEGN